jgi:hypothetical protein
MFSRYEKSKPLSLNWELKIVLYFGVLLMSGGLGLLIYKNLDTIGHLSVIVLIAILTFLCFYYAHRNHPPFSTKAALPASAFAGYVLLLGCLLFLTLEGYLQFQYQVFGTRYRMATFLFVFLAYSFDHRGVLAMALTALAAWVGVSFTPLNVLNGNEFSELVLIYSALALGASLVGVGWFLDGKGIKQHFTFTYLQFGSHLLFIATLSGLFALEGLEIVFALLLVALCYGFITYARRRQSFWFMLIAVMYGYIGFTYLVFELQVIPDDFAFYMFYFIFSCAAVIYFFLNHKKWIVRKEADRPPGE